MDHPVQDTGRTPASTVRGALLCLLLVCCSPVLYAQGAPQSAVLSIGHYNLDCIADTLVGKATGLRTYLPDVIIWGQPDSTSSCLDTIQGGHDPMTPIHPATQLVYTGWDSITGSVAFQRYNINDDRDDILLFLWGTYTDSAGTHDTARALVLFGQFALDTIPVIDVSAVDSAFQSAPFFAMDLDIGQEFLDPDERDLSGVTSYVLAMPDVVVVPPDTGGGPHHLPGPGGVAATVNVSPNPTEFRALLEAQPLAPGTYTISVIAVNGKQYHTQTVVLRETGHLERELDLSALPGGYYVVRIHDKGQFLASYPIVVVR